MHTNIKMFHHDYNNNSYILLLLLLLIFDRRSCSQSRLPNTIVLQKRQTCTIQYDYIKCETHARVLSPTVAHGNTKNVVREGNSKKKYKRVNMEEDKWAH